MTRHTKTIVVLSTLICYSRRLRSHKADPASNFDANPDPDPACNFGRDPDPDGDPDPDPFLPFTLVVIFQIKVQNLEKVLK
jgi:hypothetical protein